MRLGLVPLLAAWKCRNARFGSGLDGFPGGVQATLATLILRRCRARVDARMVVGPLWDPVGASVDVLLELPVRVMLLECHSWHLFCSQPLNSFA